MKRIAVIGAGLSGVTFAKNYGHDAEITIFEKSRGVSGRMSTRRADDFEFDHGAQYFTARNPYFMAAVEQGLADGHVKVWPSKGVYSKGNELFPDTGGDRFVSVPRMNSWLKAMATGLDVRLQHKVVGLNQTDGAWTLSFEENAEEGGFDWVVMAAPSVQVEALFPNTFSCVADLQKTKMEPCFALMIGLKTAPNIEWDTLRSEDGPASWIALNSGKPHRPEDKPTLMVHSGPNWSQRHVESDRSQIEEDMMISAASLTGLDLSNPAYTTLHRWLYANVSNGAGQDCLIDAENKLLACGDWCLGGRVEGAYLSGLAAAQTLKDVI